MIVIVLVCGLEITKLSVGVVTVIATHGVIGTIFGLLQQKLNSEPRLFGERSVLGPMS